MAQDARFEDIPLSDRPLRLKAEGAEDLAVVSSLVQDAVAEIGDIAWMPRRRRLAVVLNRFRWEDCAAAAQAGRCYERVRSALVIEGAAAAKARGLDPKARDTVISLLAITFEPGEDCGGRLVLTMAGDGELALDVECLDVTLTDLTRPWQARSAAPPAHEG